MNKISKNQKGFSAVEVIIVLVVIALIVVVGCIVYKDRHKTIGPITGKWSSYTDTAGNFRVASPTPSHPPIVIPQETHQTKEGVNYTENGIVYNAGSGAVYEVIYFTFPSISKVPTRASYVNVLLHNNQYQDTHIISSKSTSVNGNPAENYKLTTIRKSTMVPNIPGRSLPAVKLYVTAEFVHVGKILYLVSATDRSNSTSDQANAQYFVSSFKVGQ